MCEILTKKEAVEFLNLDDKLFDNFFRVAGEIQPLPRQNGRGRFKFDKDGLTQWRDSYNWRLIKLPRQAYLKCLDFALAMHFRGYVASDWGTGRQREFGQKIANWMRGQLGELAVQNFLQDKFNVEVELDFDLHGKIVPQDIIKVKENDELREPRITVGIKASKPKNAYLVLGNNEITIPERRSEIYIFTRPDLPDDHLLRINTDAFKDKVSGEQHFDRYIVDIKDLEEIPCEVAGFCSIDELEEVTSIPGQAFENGTRFVKQSGKLRKSKEDWQKLVEKL